MKRSMFRVTFRDKKTHQVTEFSRIVYPFNAIKKVIEWAFDVCDRNEYPASVETIDTETVN